MMTHEQDVLVPHHPPQPLPLVNLCSWLVTGVPGTPPQEPTAVLVQHDKGRVLQAAQGRGVWSVCMHHYLNQVLASYKKV